MKKNLVIFFGGRSCEHEISIITAQQAIANIDRGKYEIFPVYIAPDGVWRHGRGYDRLQSFASGAVPKGAEVLLTPGSPVLYRRAKPGRIKPVICIHAALLCMHGLNGEDGALQGLLELSGVPYTSCNVQASGACMDKIVSKFLFKGLGLPVTEFAWFTAGEFERGPEACLDRAEKAAGYPCIVKPANLGSSIGISVCPDRSALRAAVATAAAFDRRVLVERGLTDFFELNCSALGIENDVKISECERPAAWHEFLTFEDKYMSGGKGDRSGGQNGKENAAGGGKIGMHGLKRELPARIEPAVRDAVREATERVFRTLNAKGVVRVDFLVDKKTGTVYINEVNTIPGSLSFYFWEREGVEFPQLIDRLVYFAGCEHGLKAGLQYAYKTDVVSQAARATKTGK
ncbi:D-alanine--D-alanine ligase [Clostridia bacterium]|nr:D-alanine--D-alanine ligase [Clostridia bacterium]